MSDALVSTEEAAALLGVKPATIYTYVSRGRLHSLRKAGDVSSWFRRDEVEGLSRRNRTSTDTEPSILETAITNIDGTRYWYRDQDPTRLAETCSFEQVAEFLWTGIMPMAAAWDPTLSREARAAGHAALDADALPLDRLRVAVSTMAASDHLRFGRQPSALVVTARRLMADMIASLPLQGPPPMNGSFVARLWSCLTPQPGTHAHLKALEGALIVVADHGVAPATLAARIAASYRSDLYGAVETGLAIMAGTWHGGRSLSAENMLEEIDEVGDVEVVVGELFRLGAIPCLGQPRYDMFDPRTTMIANYIDQAEPGASAAKALRAIMRVTAERALPAPSVELALAAMARSFGLIKGSSEALFAIGRMAGWIAHAMEVYERPAAAPPRTVYRTNDGTEAGKDPR